jgi:putative membrane protein
MGLASLASGIPLWTTVACLIATLASGFLLTGMIRAVDRRSVASARRLFGLFFVSTLVWIVPLAFGVVVSRLTGLHAGSNEFVLGAFLVWGFETIVINGAFVRNTLLSLVLGAVHPLPVLALALAAGGFPFLYPALTGLLALALLMVFLVKLQSLKTKHGVPALQVLQAFMKTWVGHHPEDLEQYFAKYAKSESVTTDVLFAATGKAKVAFVLPGVHPGPFYPVGSYNLSELIYRALKGEGVDPVVLHGTGGHERNTPANSMATAYAAEISRFVGSLSPSEKGTMRGPAFDTVGFTNITSLAFGKRVLSIISNSPFLSDDLDPTSVTDASKVASGMGLQLSMVDAHNSIDGESRPQSQIAAAEWERIFTRIMALPEERFDLGFASSSELGLKLGADVSEGGICVAVFGTAGSKNALVTADSNNALSALRKRIADALGMSGIGFIELCTSDTHNSAARNLTSRGYFALGEGSGEDVIVDVVKKLALAAETRAAPCELTAARFETQTQLIGTQSLDDFAELTKNAISVSRSYTKFLGPAILLLTAITLFY